jgi:cytochrome P450
MFASFGAVGADTLGFLRRTTDRYGPIVQFPVPTPPTYLVNDAHVARQVLTAYDADFDKDTVQYRALGLVTGDGLLAACHEPWRVQRPVVQPAFHRSVNERLVADTRAAVRRLFKRWDLAPQGSVVDVEAAMMRVGLEVVGEHLFAADLVGEAPRLAAATMHALDAVIVSVRPPWSALKGLPTPAHRRFTRALAELDAAVADLVAARRDDRLSDDLLGLLLAAYPGDPVMVRNQIITFLVAGHETVASALTWTLGLLAHHPQDQDRAHAEASAELGGRLPELDDLEALPVTRACFDEALRLYPPAWIITRSASRRMVLGRREVPEGSLVIISPWLLQRDPSRWPLPDAFLPERFAGRPGAVARAATTRAEYLPFGTGQRLCIGRDFAITEAAVVLASLAQRYRFSPVTAALPRVDPLVTLRPKGGMPLRLQRR